VSGPVGCSGGKKCLVIDQVALKGVVKASNGMIAVIVNSGNKAYFMRENDPVWNGFVVKITTDSIVFRETITDRIGRTSTRDIVKRVNTPSV
jgi:Tfp pilus assembly protein PilP